MRYYFLFVLLALLLICLSHVCQGNPGDEDKPKAQAQGTSSKLGGFDSYAEDAVIKKDQDIAQAQNRLLAETKAQAESLAKSQAQAQAKATEATLALLDQFAQFKAQATEADKQATLAQFDELISKSNQYGLNPHEFYKSDEIGYERAAKDFDADKSVLAAKYAKYQENIISKLNEKDDFILKYF